MALDMNYSGGIENLECPVQYFSFVSIVKDKVYLRSTCSFENMIQANLRHATLISTDSLYYFGLSVTI